MNIIEAMSDPHLFGDQFASDTWDSWRTLLAGFYGLPVEDAETYYTLTHRAPSNTPYNELWLVIGRRGGKTNAAAQIAVYEAVFNDHASKLSKGEMATVMLIAADKKQARSAMRYVKGLLLENPMLSRMVVRESPESIELSNRCIIEIMTASHRGTRGYSVAAAILDEVAFWHSEGANPDKEILSAIRPSLATLGGKLIALSSPYARRGVLWENYRKHFGQASPRVLVAQAPSLLMNPTLPEYVVQEALQDDPAAAAAEYLAQFRTDVESFVSVESVDACTRPSHVQLPFDSKHRYFAFVDPSGGSADQFTLGIAHKDNNRIIIDAVYATKPPFSPEGVVDDYCKIVKEYRCTKVKGDAYAGEWPREQFRKHGIDYQRIGSPKSDLYRDMLPLLNSERIELPPIPALHRELINLERRTSRAGKDTIDHPPNGHDDIVNAVAGVAFMAKENYQLPEVHFKLN
tara:strand:+ start:14755 stop:16137 length:1383 start_codon:yes stop_codon:yes gene_type:complete